MAIPDKAETTIRCRRALVLAPHPDDEIFGCGGAIAAHVAAGVPVRLIILTDGALFADPGVRASESRAAAQVLGAAEPEFWGYPDGGLVYGDALVARIAETLRSSESDLVYAPSPEEVHPDHRALAMAAMEAVRRVGGATRIAFYEVGMPLHPNLFLDITPHLETKRRAMRCFASQLAHQPYDIQVEALNRFRTYTLPNTVLAAEAFHLVQPDKLVPVIQPVAAPAATGAPQGLVTIMIRSMSRLCLARALASVAAQDYGQIEVVVVAATPDHAPLEDRCGPFELRLMQGDGRRTRSEAANIALQAARGRWLMFLDDDDWILPDHVSGLVGALRDHPQAVAAYSGVHCVERSGTEWKVVRVYNEPWSPVRLLTENFLPIHSVLFRRELIEGEAPCAFDPHFDLFEDWDFWLQCMGTGRTFVHHPSITAMYCISTSSGQGVRADATAGQSALQAILEKWHTRWQPQQLQDWVADSRNLRRLLGEANRVNLELTHDIGKLSQETRSVLEMQAQLADAQNRVAALYGSLSWRITAPLRAVRRRLGGVQEALLQLRARFIERLWSVAVAFYRSSPARFFLALIPFRFKRAVRDQLMRLRTLPDARLLAPPRPRVDLKVSLIIPVFNHAQYLAQCLESALAQTYEALEVVVVDDASTDPEVGRILDGFEGRERLIIIRNTQNEGVCAAQNRALMASQGDVIGFLDCDDYLLPQAVALCLGHWQPDTVYSHSARINIDAAGREVSRIAFDHLPRQDYFSENLAAMYATHFKMIRRECFAKVGLFDPRFNSAQDYDLLMRIAFHYPSKAFKYIPEFVYWHRLHDRQMTHAAREAQDRFTGLIQAEARLRAEVRAGVFEPFVSFIMLSFGKHSQTLAAIRSLQATVKIPHEIILLDNGSDAETVSFIKENIEGRFSAVKCFFEPENLGPAAGRARALANARGPWYLFFDNDEVAQPGWLEEMLVRARSDASIGSVTAKVIFPDGRVQCVGGFVEQLPDKPRIRLGLHGNNLNTYDLATAQFLDCDWSPIGATLFTVNPAPYLHAGYPNVFEDVGVSFALVKRGLRHVNCPAAWVLHEHVAFQRQVEMGKRYMNARYDPKKMLLSVASFYRENGYLIEDDYVWRENGLTGLSTKEVLARLDGMSSLYNASHE